MSGGEAHGLQAFIARYIERLGVNGYSERTQYTYGRHLERFTEWCSERGVTRPVEVTKATIESYQKWLFHFRRDDGKALSRKTQNALVHAVSMFFRWMAKRGHLLHNPAAGIEMARVERTLPKPALTVAEVEQMLNSIDISEPLGVRDRAILEVLYSTGMRRMEAANLKLSDIDSARGIVLIRQGKGKKDRVVPIGDRALAWVDKYAQGVRPFYAKDADDGALFLSRFGTPMSNGVLTQMAHRRVAASGIEKQGALHIMRHTCATLMLEGGADVRAIQELLGHAFLSSTQVYTKVSIQRLKEIHSKTHPARLRKSRTVEPDADDEPGTDPMD